MQQYGQYGVLLQRNKPYLRGSLLLVAATSRYHASWHRARPAKWAPFKALADSREVVLRTPYWLCGIGYLAGRPCPPFPFFSPSSHRDLVDPPEHVSERSPVKATRDTERLLVACAASGCTTFGLNDRRLVRMC